MHSLQVPSILDIFTQTLLTPAIQLVHSIQKQNTHQNTHESAPHLSADHLVQLQWTLSRVERRYHFRQLKRTVEQIKADDALEEHRIYCLVDLERRKATFTPQEFTIKLYPIV